MEGRFDGDEARVDQPVKHGGGWAAKRREDEQLHHGGMGHVWGRCSRRHGAAHAWGTLQPWSQFTGLCSQEATDV